MKELIEKLKDKNYVRAFGLMTPEEQECLRKAGPKGGVIMYNDRGWESRSDWNFDCPRITYAIKPDYKPEPEFVDLEIKVNTKYPDYEWLGVLDEDCPFPLPHIFTHLHCLPSLPNFDGFYNKKTDGETRENITWIATLISEGMTVYARFRS